MHERGKSDKPVVPGKSANTGGGKPLMVEWMEGRGLAKGNPNQQNEFRAQYRQAADKENPKRARSGKPRTLPRGDTCLRSHDSHSALDRIREAARRRAAARQDPRQEPSAVTPLAGIRGGGGIKVSSILRPNIHTQMTERR
jgi:hypothetical protein